MYTEDILGGNFVQKTFRLKSDSEGEVFCTLVKLDQKEKHNKNMLYIHGFSDYFIQEELAEEFFNNGYNFYALDLRKNGRSLREWQKPSNLFSIEDYFEDFDVAIKQIKEENAGDLYFYGHSTGGLAIALYLAKRVSILCKALILNSPFLEMNKKWTVRKIGIPLISIWANIQPNGKLHKAFSPLYGESLHSSRKGEWNYSLEWKPIAVEYVTFSWLSAIYKAHRKLRKGLNLKCPVLVLSSGTSLRSRVWSEEFLSSDVVLNIKDIEKRSKDISKNSVYLKVEGGIHDLALSRKNVRKNMYNIMFNWLNTIK